MTLTLQSSIHTQKILIHLRRHLPSHYHTLTYSEIENGEERKIEGVALQLEISARPNQNRPSSSISLNNNPWTLKPPLFSSFFMQNLAEKHYFHWLRNLPELRWGTDDDPIPIPPEFAMIVWKSEIWEFELRFSIGFEFIWVAIPWYWSYVCSIRGFLVRILFNWITQIKSPNFRSISSSFLFI